MLVPLRLLPADWQAGAASLGMSLALSPSLLASSLGLGRLLGLSHAVAAAEQAEAAAVEPASPTSAASTQVRAFQLCLLSLLSRVSLLSLVVTMLRRAPSRHTPDKQLTCNCL